jgi:Uma2 family endonuclease
MMNAREGRERGGNIKSMPTRGTLTYADLETFPDDGFRRELIDGELFVSPSPKTRHQIVSGRLHLALGNHVNAYGGAAVFYAPLDVLFSDRDVVEPDLIVVTNEQTEIVTEKNIQGVPALLVEIVSDPRYDRVEKRNLYAKYGVPLYWIVDPDADRVEVYRLEQSGYAKPEILEPGEVLELDILPGFRLAIADLLAR